MPFSAEIAQNIVRLGLDLRGITTLATLETGVTFALKAAIHRRLHPPAGNPSPV